MQTESSENPRLLELGKQSLCFGLLMGMIFGAGWAFYQTWILHQYVQKGLSFFVLEIFSESIIGAGLIAVLLTFVLYPMLALFSRYIAEIRKPRLARLVALIFAGVCMAAGYLLNKSPWYPPVRSTVGLIGNLALSLALLGIGILVYKLLTTKSSMGSKTPVPLIGRIYHGLLFAVVTVCFVGFNLYAYIKVSGNQPAGPNVLFITIDTLRADRLGCYGHFNDTSPTIDRLAQEGTLFASAHAQRGLTWPSLTSIMTSLYPKTHGVLKNQWPLDAHFTTLAEILKNRGYKTGAFVANFYYAPNRGFDVKKGGEVGNLDKTVTRDALDWLNGIKPEDDKFFMWIHYKNPHDPYTPPKHVADLFDSTYTGPFDGSRPMLDSIYVNRVDLDERDLSYINALYDAEIRTTDGYIDRILQRLAEMGLTDNTLVVFSADHGEELYEKNYYFFHSCSMYDAVLHIPLIMKLPGIIPAGQVIPNQIESIDITPTVLQFLKLPLSEEFEGRSVLPMIFGETNGAWHPVFAERAGSIFSIRTPKWKYIYNPDDYHTYCSRSDDDDGEGYIIEVEELYDLENDPGETTNVVSYFPDIAKELRGQIIDWQNTNKRVHREHKLTKEAEERLRALGYIK